MLSRFTGWKNVVSVAVQMSRTLVHVAKWGGEGTGVVPGGYRTALRVLHSHFQIFFLDFYRAHLGPLN